MKTVNGIEVWDTLPEIIDPQHTALIVVDVQNDCVHPDGWFAKNGKDVSAIEKTLGNIVELVSLARANGVLPVFIEQTTLPDNLSDPPGWLHFKTRDGRTRTDYTVEGTWGHQIIDELAVRPDEPRIRKFRPSSFLGTPLDMVLRAHHIASVVVCGVVTQGCVQATVMDASFHNYYTVVAEDAVASFSPALHENALTFMRSRYECAGMPALRAVWSAEPEKVPAGTAGGEASNV